MDKTLIPTDLDGWNNECIARPLHLGRTTHLWDAEVRSRASGRAIAQFRCIQLIQRA